MKIFKLMLPVAAFLALLSSLPAKAEDCRLRLNTRGGPWSAMNSLDEQDAPRAMTKLKAIIENKGYTLTEDKSAPYYLSAAAGWGWGCGTGLSKLELAFPPSNSSVYFTKNNTVSINKYFSIPGLPIGGEQRAISRTLRIVKRLLPICNSGE